MIVSQLVWRKGGGWDKNPGSFRFSPQLILVFWSAEYDAVESPLLELLAAFPDACMAGCTTAGEIAGAVVLDKSLTVTLIEFDSAIVKSARVCLDDYPGSREAGAALVEVLPVDELRHVLVLADGLHVNGSNLVKGVVGSIPEGVSVTGGLAGDGDHFQSTMTLLDGLPEERGAVAIGLYGDSLKVGYGSKGGWDAFGPERLITKSDGNILYEVDGKSVLRLYEEYLGKHADELPAAGLLFPLSIRKEGSGRSLVRTILGIDREQQSMTFAGDVPQGTYARFMMSNLDRLVDGALDAASVARRNVDNPGLALLISCVGRKLILKQMVEEEIEGVQEVVGDNSVLAGFYSYGELAPFANGSPCDLHNQTMTVTLIGEE